MHPPSVMFLGIGHRSLTSSWKVTLELKSSSQIQSGSLITDNTLKHKSRKMIKLDNVQIAHPCNRGRHRRRAAQSSSSRLCLPPDFKRRKGTTCHTLLIERGRTISVARSFSSTQYMYFRAGTICQCQNRSGAFCLSDREPLF